LTWDSRGGRKDLFKVSERRNGWAGGGRGKNGRGRGGKREPFSQTEERVDRSHQRRPAVFGKGEEKTTYGKGGAL